MVSRYLFVAALAVIDLAACFWAEAAEPIEIGSRRELLVDDYLIERLSGAALTLHKPTPREVVIVHDAPWEGDTCFYHTVFQDGDLYRMYYRGSQWSVEANDMLYQVACYAQSKDGIHWTKPELGLHEFNGSKKNNIVHAGRGSDNFMVFKDSRPDCPAEAQYKAFGGVSDDGGIWTFQSPDGIHWSPLSKGPVITEGAFDSLNLAFWDSTRNRYVEFHRAFRNGFRDIMTSTSTDFQNWTQPVFLEYPNMPPEHLYTNSIAPYDRAKQIFMGFPKRFIETRNPTGHFKWGVSDGVFMTSRDGLNFRRWGEAVVRPGFQKSRWVDRNNYTASGVVVTRSDIPDTPDELSIYSLEDYYLIGTASKLRRYTYRMDGFVSVQAPLAGGELVSKPLGVSGDRLEINYSTSAAGSIRVEIQDAQGVPIEGYKLDDSVEIFGDEIERALAWKSGSDVARLAGKPVRLRFVMKDADLYSIQAVAALQASPSASGSEGDGSVQFTDHLIMSDYQWTFGIGLADLDGDGDLDVISSDANGANKLYWFENDGKGNFQQHLIQENDPQELQRHAVGDVNGDGHLDVVIVKNKEGEVLWFENSGHPREARLWTRHRIGKLTGAYDVALADLNGDGRLDAAAASWSRGNQFAWFENTGSPETGEWTRHGIEENLADTRTIRVADFNKDGNPDLLGTARGANLVVWYVNDGKGNFTKQVIDDKLPAPMHGQPVDMNGDGNVDVVMAAGMLASQEPGAAQVIWYENPGSPFTGRWQKQVICSRFPSAFEAVATDLDGDGDKDVVATSWHTSSDIAWFENSGDPQGPWKTHVLTQEWKVPTQTLIGDLNGDGRPDIISGNDAPHELRWWSNEGRKNR